MNLLDLFTRKNKTNPNNVLEKYSNNYFKIIKLVPNTGQWDELHCVYVLSPIFEDNTIDECCEIYIALPNNPPERFWNKMALASNNKLSIMLPDSPNMFIVNTMSFKFNGNFDIDVYVHKSLR